MLNFQGTNRVSREDWRRGTRAMALHDMGEDDKLWEKLLQKFGSNDTIDLRNIEDLVPIDPRVSLLLKVRRVLPPDTRGHTARLVGLTDVRARTC